MTPFQSFLIDHKKLRPYSDADLKPLETALVDALDTIPEIVVQKVRRQPHNEIQLEATCVWTGAAADDRDVLATIRNAFPWSALPTEQKFETDRERDRVEIRFAAVSESGRLLRGRVVTIL
jgi:hypothetical protein